MGRVNGARVIGAVASIASFIPGYQWLAFVGAAFQAYASNEEARQQARQAADAFNASQTDRTVTIQSATAPRRLAFGYFRLSGPIGFAASTGENKDTLHLQIPICEGPIDGVEAIYVGDERAQLDADGFATNLLLDDTTSRPGVLSETTDASGFIAISKPVLHVARYRGTGLATTLTSELLNFLPVAGGVIVYGTIDGLAPNPRGRIGSVTGVYEPLKNSLVQITYEAGDPKKRARFKVGLGEPDQPGIPELLSECSLPATHRLRGVANLYVRIQAGESSLSQGLSSYSIEGRGLKCYDPRNDRTVWTRNPALCILAMLTHPMAGGLSIEEIDVDSFIAAANACDETVDLGGGQRQVRYTCDGTVDLVDNFDALAEARRMATSCAGWLFEVAGKWHLRAGVYEPADLVMPAEAIVNAMTVSPFDSVTKRFNTVRGKYRPRANGFTAVDFPPYVASAYKVQDGREVSDDIDLPFTSDPIMAQRLAKIHMLRSRNSMTSETLFDLRAIDIMPSRTFAMDVPAMGWPKKPFVAHSVEITLDGVKVTSREDGPEIYDWLYIEQTDVDPTPNTNLPDPRKVAAPSVVSVESGDDHALISDDGTVTVRALVKWTLTADQFVRVGGRVELIWQRLGDTKWTSLPSVDAEQDSAYIAPLAVTDIIVVGARFRNSIGAASPYTYSIPTAIRGRTGKPSDVERIAFRGDDSVEWTPVPDRDLAGYVIRYVAGDVPDWDHSMPMHDGVVAVSPWRFKLRPRGRVTVMIKAVNSSGAESANAANTSATLPDSSVRLTYSETRYDRNLGLSNDMSYSVPGVLSRPAGASEFPTFDASGWLNPAAGFSRFGASIILQNLPVRSGAPYWLNVVPTWQGEQCDIYLFTNGGANLLRCSDEIYVSEALDRPTLVFVVSGSLARAAKLKDVLVRASRLRREVSFSIESVVNVVTANGFGFDALDRCDGFILSPTGGVATKYRVRNSGNAGGGAPTFPAQPMRGYLLDGFNDALTPASGTGQITFWGI